MKDGAYIINLEEYELIGTLWIALYVNALGAIFFDYFVVEPIPKEIGKFYGKKSIIRNTFSRF